MLTFDAFKYESYKVQAYSKGIFETQATADTRVNTQKKKEKTSSDNLK